MVCGSFSTVYRDEGKASTPQFSSSGISDSRGKPSSTKGPDRSPAKVVPTTDTMANSQPRYFEVAPDSHMVFPPRDAKTEPEPSTALSKQKTKGIYSHDPILDHNPDELWRFLASNLKPPRLAVRLSGTHTEKIYKSSRVVTDFSIQIDISDLVTPWSQLYAHTAGAPKAGAPIEQLGSQDARKQAAGPTVREAVEEYTSSENVFKEFRKSAQDFFSRNCSQIRSAV